MATNLSSQKNAWGVFNSKKVPLLRGKINLLFFIIFPVFMYYFLSHDMDLDRMTFSIFSFCSLFNYLASIILHSKIWNQELYSVLRKIDYAGIFLMIGGCGIPSYVAFMTSDLVVVLTVVHWVLLFSGVFGSLVFNFCYTSKRARSVVYVLVSVPYFAMIPFLMEGQHHKAMFFIIVGGIFYMLGAIVYGSRLPNLVPGIFEYHELFHIFCMLGFSGMSVGNFFLCKRPAPSFPYGFMGWR